ncbi:Dabb family protein [soil metagenome]
MIRHLVLLKWNEGVDTSHVVATKTALDQLPRVISQIVSYHNGPDLQLAPSNWDHAVSADFVSIEDYVAYRDHPAHQEVVKTYLTDFCQRLAVQLTLD